MINARFTWFYEAGLTALAATVIFGALAVYGLLAPGQIGEIRSPSRPAVWPVVDPQGFSFAAAVFKKANVEIADLPRESAAKRFRLAGTFFASGVNQQARKAILDDLPKQTQVLVAEGDRLDNETQVVAIMADRVTLRRGTVDEQIILCFTGRGKAGPQPPAPTAFKAKSPLEIQNRFGKRVGDKRWVLTRSDLMSYYSEVMNNTDRLAKIYESLKPVYQGANIAGYTLDIEGEGEMFMSFGLQQGDIIRQVNSLPMTSQMRAEYFIGEFVKNRVNAFVLDIERSGKQAKLIYMVR